MLETVRRRETADAALVAVLWAAISVAISVAGQIALFLPVVSSLVIYATVEAFRFSCGTPLRGSGLWRMATLALWTAIGYATFVAGEWYLLPISLIFLGIVLFEDKRSRRPSAASDVANGRNAEPASNRSTTNGLPSIERNWTSIHRAVRHKPIAQKKGRTLSRCS